MGQFEYQTTYFDIFLSCMGKATSKQVDGTTCSWSTSPGPLRDVATVLQHILAFVKTVWSQSPAEIYIVQSNHLIRECKFFHLEKMEFFVPFLSS